MRGGLRLRRRAGRLLREPAPGSGLRRLAVRGAAPNPSLPGRLGRISFDQSKAGLEGTRIAVDGFGGFEGGGGQGIGGRAGRAIRSKSAGCWRNRLIDRMVKSS